MNELFVGTELVGTIGKISKLQLKGDGGVFTCSDVQLNRSKMKLFLTSSDSVSKESQTSPLTIHAKQNGGDVMIRNVTFSEVDSSKVNFDDSNANVVECQMEAELIDV